MTAVTVNDLTVEVSATGAPIVNGVSFAVDNGRVLGLVGESGSGKSTVAMALLGFARRGARITAGSVVFQGLTDLLALPPADLWLSRGRLVAYVPQDPSVSLNPAIRLDEQLTETLTNGATPLKRHEALERVVSVLDEVDLPTDASFLRRYPHELSGGQQQRVAIAMAVSSRPRLLVLDEPTTGLDVTTQARVLEMVGRLCTEHDLAAVYVSHDLGVVASVSHDIMVLYGGRALEYGSRAQVFDTPRHPYTMGLLNAVPTTDARRRLQGIEGRAPEPSGQSVGCVFAPRCGFADPRCAEDDPEMFESEPGHLARCIRVREIPRWSAGVSAVLHASRPGNEREEGSTLSVRELSAGYGTRLVLTDVSLDLDSGECLAMVGESGSGKSTLARCLIGLHEPHAGKVLLEGKELAARARSRPILARERLQYVFQNPYASLNPRRKIGDSVAVPLGLFSDVHGAAAKNKVHAALDRVGLSPSLAGRYPAELSGGERQRAAIARALVCEPSVLICDEVTSALDVSVQAAVVELLRSLLSEGLALLFVTHNLAVVRSIADRVMVLSLGRVVETNDADALFAAPTHEYTKRLLADSAAAGLGEGANRSSEAERTNSQIKDWPA